MAWRRSKGFIALYGSGGPDPLQVSAISKAQQPIHIILLPSHTSECLSPPSKAKHSPSPSSNPSRGFWEPASGL